MHHDHKKCEACGRKIIAGCDCGHHSIIPVLVVIAATLFLLGEQGYVSSSFVNTVWPILLGIGGISKLNEHNCGCC